MIKKIRVLLLLAFGFFILSLSFKGYCETLKNDNQPIGISRNDSIVIDIINIINEGQDLDFKRKQAIEDKMENFPGKVVRRDTVTFFLQTALEIAYHEYVKEDVASARKSAGNFLTDVQEYNPLKTPIRYGLIKFTGITFPNLDANRRKIDFLTSLLSELPLNLDINTYSELFYALKAQGALYSFLDSSLENNFIDKCKANNRSDILNCIAYIWDIPDSIGTESTAPPEYEIEDSISPAYLKKEVDKILKDFSYKIIDAYGNLDVIDSLIQSNNLESIGEYMSNFQNITFHGGELRALIDNSKKYENFIPNPSRLDFYDIWGVSHSYLGEHEDAIRIYNKALEYVNDEVNEAVINMNIALSTCELGYIEVALSKIKKYEEILNKSGNRFHYLDALAYIVSKIDKEEALKLYEEADDLLEHTINNKEPYFKYGFQPFITRHFVREAQLYDNDLFKWRNALRLARDYSGVDSYFDFFEGLPQGLYFSALARYRSFLFDNKGFHENYEKADRAFAQLDSCDFRVLWMNECIKDIPYYAPSKYSSEEIINILQSKGLSPLHNIWLCSNLAYHISQSLYSNIHVLNSFLKDNIAEAILALPSHESKFLTGPLKIIQDCLMTDEIVSTETENVANLNLLRKGLSQSSKALIEKNLSGYFPEQYNGLVKLRRDLNSAYAYEDSLKVKKLLPKIMEKESELYYSVKDSVDLDTFIGKSVNSVRNHLSQNEVAIDFICSQQEDTIQIGAFIIQKGKPTAFVRLKNILSSEGALSIEDVYDIWEPLGPFIENKENIYFSPDGMLLNIGIEFFPALNGSPIIYDYRIHRVSHLREIKNGEININGEIALIGISDHNSPIGEGETIYRGNWVDMPGVKNEIETLDLVLNDFPHSVYFNDTATESGINDLNGNNISVLHFSTHGIYRDFNALNHSLTDPSHFDFNIAKRTLNTDRQSICGLILRGGNISWKMPHILDENDDILMDDEIENMNFPELRLTVLSACSSALGEIDSDGIQGLQRAFRIAGSKNIICSLKEVNDYWAEQFMILLYQNLANGISIYDSFRNTQRRLYEAEPDKKDVWSSFILIE